MCKFFEWDNDSEAAGGTVPLNTRTQSAGSQLSGDCFNVSTPHDTNSFFSERGTNQTVWNVWTLGQRYVSFVHGGDIFAMSLMNFMTCLVCAACPTRNQKDGLKRSKTTVTKSRDTTGTAGVECVKCGEDGHTARGEWQKRDVGSPSRCANFDLVRLSRPLGLHWREPWLESKSILLARLGLDARGRAR